AGSWLSSMHDYSVFAIQAYPSPGIKHDSLLRVIDEEIERIKRAGVTEEELERALRLVYANLVISGQSLYRRGLTIGNFYIVADDPLGVNHYFERLKGVKLEDIKRVASKYLLSTKRVIAFMDTKKESE
ncbi:MAG: insulinase family protein, partial [Candidatus Hydrothermae bacterium]|nr:insulinase family protein [Candidatus Hydrothermae bacterium]